MSFPVISRLLEKTVETVKDGENVLLFLNKNVLQYHAFGAYTYTETDLKKETQDLTRFKNTQYTVKIQKTFRSEEQCTV